MILQKGKDRTVKRRILSIMLTLALVILLTQQSALAVDDGFSSVYTYNYDYWGEVVESPDAYRVEQVVSSASLNLEVPMSSPQSLFATGNTLYIVDRGNNRVLQTVRTGYTFSLSRIIDTATGTEDDYKTAEAVYKARKAYEDLIKQREDAEKKLDQLKTELKDLDYSEQEEILTEEEKQKAGEKTEQKEKEIQETELLIEQLAEQMPAAYDTALEEETKAREAGCRIWQYEAWHKDEEGKVTSTLDSPNDISVDKDGNMYFADTNNQRILKTDKDCNLLWEFVKPLDSTFDQKYSFLPTKIVTDSTGRVFALATSVNKGLIKFEADGTFTGFIGANKVTYNTWDYIWKRYLSTREQRAQMADFVPTEYKNLYIDQDGFIYATNVNFSEYDLMGDGAKPIRRLNMLGDDILIKNDRYPPIGDLDWKEGMTPNDYHGPSKLYDITVLDDDMYCAIDRSRGRIFGYDQQGIMLWAFGTRGAMEGASNGAVSIEHMGYDLIMLDEFTGNITVFTPTKYGQMIYQANHQYLTGDYDGSAATWKDVQKLNANYKLAYIGIGRAQMRKEDFTGAMENFKTAYSRVNYGKAYRYYRQEWMEKNILWVALAIGALVVFLLLRGMRRKSKWEVFEHERSKAFKQR